MAILPAAEEQGCARKADTPQYVSRVLSFRALSLDQYLCILHSIRFSPPLVITDAELQKAIGIILQSLGDFDTAESIPDDEADEVNIAEASVADT